jgi:hypothetical protein
VLYYGRNTDEAFVNLTLSIHNESYTNRAWPGKNGMPHAGLDRDDCRANNDLARMRAWITYIPENTMDLPELHD